MYSMWTLNKGIRNIPRSSAAGLQTGCPHFSRWSLWFHRLRVEILERIKHSFTTHCEGVADTAEATVSNRRRSMICSEFNCFHIDFLHLLQSALLSQDGKWWTFQRDKGRLQHPSRAGLEEIHDAVAWRPTERFHSLPSASLVSLTRPPLRGGGG